MTLTQELEGTHIIITVIGDKLVLVGCKDENGNQLVHREHVNGSQFRYM